MTTQFIKLETITNQELQAAGGGKRTVNIVPAQVIQGPIVIGNPQPLPPMPWSPFPESNQGPKFPAMPS